MKLNGLFRKEGKPTLSKVEEDESIHLIDFEENKNRQLETINVDNSKTDRIHLMDMSLDSKWICYVSQYIDDTSKVSTTLSRRRFKALNAETSTEEYSKPVLSDENSISPESRLQMETNLQPQIISIPIDQYFDISKFDFQFLSISSNGQYIALSNYDKTMQDTDGSCIVFIVHKNVLLFHGKVKCSGRAVFFNRKKETCLAILNTKNLRTYHKIDTFSEKSSYDLYDLTSFGSSAKDFQESCSAQLFCRNFVHNWAGPSNITRLLESIQDLKINHIITLSKYIRIGVLVTPFYEKNGIIRFWSLNNNGVLLASLVAPGETVIAISGDMKYAATAREKCIYIYNLEHGCRAYTLKSNTHVRELDHATFCHNSRYLALSAISNIHKNNDSTLRGRYLAIFEVWYVEGEALIYSKNKSFGSMSPREIKDLNRVKTLNPFVCEEFTEDERRILKGYYSYVDPEGVIITRCLELKIDDQQSNNIIQWLSNSHSPNSPNNPVEEYLDTLSLRGRDFEYHEISSKMEGYSLLKCGHIFLENGGKYLLRCGIHMVQLWEIFSQSADDNSSSEINNYRLVYIKLYTNSDYRSFYLSPNIWRLENFKSIKYIDGPLKPRLILNIVEDKQYLVERTENSSTTYTEEFVLPTPAENDFNYHKFEGACQTLYYLNILRIKQDQRKDNLNFDEDRFSTLYKETNRLILDEIRIIDDDCTAFKSTAASKTLAMLASFEDGREILKLLLKNGNIFINLTSYKVLAADGKGTLNSPESNRYSSYYNAANSQIKLFETSGHFSNEVKYRRTLFPKINDHDLMNENVLTVLIREREYDLYYLLLNRILLDSRSAVPECLSVLTDALLLLQELGLSEQYERSCSKLSYLPAWEKTLTPLEIAYNVTYKEDLLEDLIENMGDLYSFSAVEHLKKLRTSKFDLIWDTIAWPFKAIMPNTWMTLKTFSTESSTRSFDDFYSTSLSSLTVCVIPLPHFNTYYYTSVRDVFLNDSQDPRKGGDLSHIQYKKESTFLHSAINQHKDPNIWKQGDDVMAVLLQYKWNAFIRNRFYLFFIIYIVYYVTYCTGVQFAKEMYNYDSANTERSITANGQHATSVILLFASGAILFLLEVKQLFGKEKFKSYFLSWYNYVDLAAIIFPVINFLQLRQNWNYFYEITSICTLILWIHAIIRLRVFSSFGIALETIIQLFKAVSSVLLIFLLVIFGFTHSFIALLRQKDDQYFQENYGGLTNLSNNNLSTTAGETTLYDLSSSNGFSDPFKAFYHVWLFIFGVWDPVTEGDAGDNRMLFVLCIIFAFITVFIFTNMIIALMSSTVDEVKKRGKRVWIRHFAEVIAEIEDLTSDNVDKQEKKLEQETKELRKILGIDEDEHTEAANDNRTLQELIYNSHQINNYALEELKHENERNSVAMEEIKNDLQSLYQLFSSYSPQHHEADTLKV